MPPGYLFNQDLILDSPEELQSSKSNHFLSTEICKRSFYIRHRWQFYNDYYHKNELPFLMNSLNLRYIHSCDILNNYIQLLYIYFLSLERVEYSPDERSGANIKET